MSKNEVMGFYWQRCNDPSIVSQGRPPTGDWGTVTMARRDKEEAPAGRWMVKGSMVGDVSSRICGKNSHEFKLEMLHKDSILVSSCFI